MGKDRITLDQTELERRLNSKEGKIPQGLSKNIRRLKQQGRNEEAEKRRSEFLEKKANRAYLELEKTIDVILDTDDPIKEAVNSIKAAHLLSNLNEIDVEERRDLIRDVYKLHPNDEDMIEEEWMDIQPEVDKLLTKSS